VKSAGRLSATFALALTAGLALPASAGAATITPNTFDDDNTSNGNCTLREAVISANTDAAIDACAAGTGADEIPLQSGTYELSVPVAGEDAAATGDLDITDPDGLTITGGAAGSIVDANGIDRIFNTLAAATATFDRLTITGGSVSGDMGGAIDVAGGSTASIIDSTLTGNTATGEGGAIEVHNPGTVLNLIGSTVAGNASTGAIAGDGGGLEYDTSTSIVNVMNTTFSGNTAAGEGGAIEMEGGTGTFVNVTITNNSAPSAGGIVMTDDDGSVNLKGTILAGNTATTAPDCTTATPTPITSQGHNLIGTTSGCTFAGQGTDLLGQDPLLGPLADNGGPTETHALLAGSPAIDAGPPDAPPTDQRGAPRNPDIGAYELVLCGAVVVNRIGSGGDDDLTGTEGPDAFLMLAGNDTATGLGGNDAFCGGDGNDSAAGGAGDDTAQGDAGNDAFSGGDGDDTDAGGEGDDTTSGDAGNDTAQGDAGNDVVNGGDGNDQLKGLAGKDRLKGADGKDRVKGGNGKDRLNGGMGKDKLNGGKSKDICKGAGGKDTATGCEKEKQIP
jgi:CSLREA domain-containing protein